MLYIGGDIHKNISTFNVMNDRFRTVNELIDVPTSEDGFRQITRTYGPDDCFILIESSTRSNYVARFFRTSGYQIIVGHAKDLKKLMSNEKAKTDRIDARKLAEQAKSYYEWMTLRPADDESRPVRPPFKISRVYDLSEYHNRTMTRQLADLVSLNSKYKKSLQEYMSAMNIHMPTNFKSVDSQRSLAFLDEIPDDNVRNMASMIRQTMDWEDRMTDRLKDTLENDDRIRLLMTITGIDFRTAAYLALYIGDVTEFDSPDKLVAYFGLAPKVSESANKGKNGLSINRDSSGKIRRAVYNAVRAHVRFCKRSDVSKFYLRMYMKMGERKAETAAARKLVTVIWAMLTYNEPFRLHPAR